MSEKAEKPAKEGGKVKKKKGKLPMIIALVAVLGGGGFFMMKPKGKAAKPEIKIGKEVVEIGEVLVNLRGEDSYARLNIGLQFAADFDAAHLDAAKPIIRDAIIVAVSAKTVREIQADASKSQLKRDIATAINKALHAMHPTEGSHEKKPDEPKEKGGDAHGAEPKETKRAHPEWDSDEGPVLKVYFSDFVTQ